jgi:tungstate transport system ATP-binding protein
MNGHSHEAGAAILTGRNLIVREGDTSLLDIEQVEVRGGEILSVLGPNGAGKSTLMRVLAMLQTPDAGVVSFRDLSGAAAEKELRRDSACVFQRPHLWAGTVRENLELPLRLRRRAPDVVRRAAGEAAVQLGIEELLERDALTLSGGEAQRAAIARAVAVEPDLLFLDEPGANLDVSVRNALMEDLERIGRDGRHATVLATHDRAEAFSLADRVVVLRAGRIVQSGAPEDLFENPADPFIAAVTGAELSFRATVLEAGGGLLHVRVGDTSLTASGDAEPGRDVRIAYRPEDLFLSRREIGEASPRNRFRARVTEVRSAGSLLRVRLEGSVSWVAVVTRAAGDELSLDVGSEIWVQVKATALHAFPS